jgi:hypothetical protein
MRVWLLVSVGEMRMVRKDPLPGIVTAIDLCQATCPCDAKFVI